MIFVTLLNWFFRWCQWRRSWLGTACFHSFRQSHAKRAFFYVVIHAQMILNMFLYLNIFQWQTGKCHRNPWDDRPCFVLKFFVVAAGAWPCWPPAVPHAISCICLQNPQFWKHEHRLKGSLHLPFTQAWILAPIVTPQRAVVPRPNLSPYFCSLHTLFSTDLVSPRATVRIGSKTMPHVFACWWLLLQHQ